MKLAWESMPSAAGNAGDDSGGVRFVRAETAIQTNQCDARGAVPNAAVKTGCGADSGNAGPTNADPSYAIRLLSSACAALMRDDIIE